MNVKSKLAVATAGMLALGGSAFGSSLATGVASAAPAPGVTSPSAPPATADVTVPGDPGAAVQSGPQTGPDTASAADTAETPSTEASASTEATASETSTATDGPGGHQDPAGNVDHQSTTEQ
jgi:hypothetical protein